MGPWREEKGRRGLRPGLVQMPQAQEPPEREANHPVRRAPVMEFKEGPPMDDDLTIGATR